MYRHSRNRSGVIHASPRATPSDPAAAPWSAFPRGSSEASFAIQASSAEARAVTCQRPCGRSQLGLQHTAVGARYRCVTCEQLRPQQVVCRRPGAGMTCRTPGRGHSGRAAWCGRWAGRRSSRIIPLALFSNAENRELGARPLQQQQATVGSGRPSADTPRPASRSRPASPPRRSRPGAQSGVRSNGRLQHRPGGHPAARRPRLLPRLSRGYPPDGLNPASNWVRYNVPSARPSQSGSGRRLLRRSATGSRSRGRRRWNLKVTHALKFAPPEGDSVQNQAAHEAEERQRHQAGRQHRGRQAGHQSGLGIGRRLGC